MTDARVLAYLKYVADYLRYLDRKLDRAIALLKSVQQSEEAMHQNLSDIQDLVRQDTDVVSSAVTLLGGLGEEIKKLVKNRDPVALDALADQLISNKQRLADAVVANTGFIQPPPAPPAPEPTPAPVTPPADTTVPTTDTNPPTP
jgi:hypothetical protein